MSILFTETTPTNATRLGIKNPTHSDLSEYAYFHFTFLGFNFVCNHTNTIKRKSQVFLANPSKARNMAKSLIIPAHYSLIPYASTNLNQKLSA